MIIQPSNKYNLVGIWTLYQREVKRFLLIPGQTLFAPAVSVAMFIIIFTFSLRATVLLPGLGAFPMILFVVPGLVIMNILQGSFMNNSSSVLLSKNYGSIFDLLVAPLSTGEIIFATTMAGITRGLLLGGVILTVAQLLVGISFHNYLALIIFLCLGSGCMALVGTISGIWADNFERLSLIAQIIIMPLTFLSGTFYPTANLPDSWQQVFNFNPIFHAINGFRYAVIGYSDQSVVFSFCFLLTVFLGLWLAAFLVLRSGYKLKS